MMNNNINNNDNIFVLLGENGASISLAAILLLLDVAPQGDMTAFAKIIILGVSIYVCNRFSKWLPVLIALSVVHNVGLPLNIPGVNLVTLGFLIFLIFAICLYEKKATISITMLRVVSLLSVILIFRIISSSRTVFENVIPETFAMIRNMLVFYCAYMSVCECMIARDRKINTILLQLTLSIFAVYIFECFLLSHTASGLDFKYNFDLKMETVAFNDIRNSMGVGAAGVGRVSGVSVLFCLFLLICYPRYKIIWASLLSICGYCLLLSFTKTGQVGVLLAFIIATLFYRQYKTAVIFTVILVFAIYIVPDYFWVRIFQAVEDERVLYGADFSRMDMATSPFREMTLDDLWFGLGTYGYLLGYGGSCVYRAHNGITDAIVEGGVLGVILLLLFAFLSWSDLCRSRYAKDDNDGKLFSMLSVAIWIFFLIFFINGGTFLYSGSGVIFLSMWGFCVARKNFITEHHYEGRNS